MKNAENLTCPLEFFFFGMNDTNVDICSLPSLTNPRLEIRSFLENCSMPLDSCPPKKLCTVGVTGIGMLGRGASPASVYVKLAKPTSKGYPGLIGIAR